jgi:hypothetical protein
MNQKQDTKQLPSQPGQLRQPLCCMQCTGSTEPPARRVLLLEMVLCGADALVILVDNKIQCHQRITLSVLSHAGLHACMHNSGTHLAARAAGSAAITSPSPPDLDHGATSVVTNTTCSKMHTIPGHCLSSIILHMLCWPVATAEAVETAQGGRRLQACLEFGVKPVHNGGNV